MPKDYVAIEFPSLAENVRLARLTAAVFASRLDFTLDEIEDVKWATSEAVSNAVVHGYQEGPGLVRMTAAIEDGALVITVQDEGKGIEDVAWAEQAANTTMPDEHMGLGLVFIKEFMNEATIQSSVGKGTVVRMVKRPAQVSTGAGVP